MIFFTVLGWLILLLFALGITFALPWLMLMMASFEGAKDSDKWFVLVPFLLGCLALYGLFTHSPFHIVLS